MALNNLLSPRQQVQTSKGQPLAGGSVFLYLPGTTTFIPSFMSSNITAQNPYPVPLSSSGRAEIWVTRDCDMVITDRNGNVVVTQDNANPGAVGQDVSGLIPNGSFEIDTNGDGLPDGWDIIDYTNSTNLLDSTTQTDGVYSWRFTAADANGGGNITTSDFFPVNGVNNLTVTWDMISSITGLNNIVRVSWYDATLAFISSDNLYNTTTPPLVWTTFQVSQAPPPTARFAKLNLFGVEVGTGPGSTWFDRVSAAYPALGSGIFDNITIQNNEIISTNTNGEITIEPNGTGELQLGSVTGGLGTTTVYYNALPAAQWNQAGYTFLFGSANANPATGDAVTNAISFSTQDSNFSATVGLEGTNDFLVQNFHSGGDLLFKARTTGAAIRQMLLLSADTGTTLYHTAGTSIAQSLAAASGGLQVNNTLTGAGLERVLTLSDLPPAYVTPDQYGRVAADIPSVNDTLANAVGMGVTLAANTRYAIEGFLQFTCANATPDVKFLFTTTDAHQGDNLTYIHSSNDSPTAFTLISEWLTTTNTFIPIAATDTITVYVKGYIQTHASNAPVVQFQFAQNVTDANATSLLEGSWLSYTDLDQ